jgi:hypothetical protein
LVALIEEAETWLARPFTVIANKVGIRRGPAGGEPSKPKFSSVSSAASQYNVELGFVRT